MSGSLSVTLRPTTFEAVVGNLGAVSALRKQLESDSKPVAYVLSGPPGTGKTTLAYLIAKSLGISDITEVNASDQNGIEDVRELVRLSAFRPFSGSMKAVILDEAHRLTEPAQNVLLKPMEDPRNPTIWIIATTEPGKLLPALRRRCFPVVLRGLQPEEVALLVKRAAAAAGGQKPTQELVEALASSGMTSPGEIVMATERWVRGVPAAEAAIAVGQHEPLYADVARAVLQGNWSKTAELLKGIKTADVRGLRAVLAAFFGPALLDCPLGSTRGDGISAAIRGLAMYQSYEDGVAYNTTRAVLYEACKKLRPAQKETELV